MKRGPGRPTLLTPELEETLVAYVRQGAYDWVAAQAVGIDPATFYRWMQLGRDFKQSKYHEFYEKVCRSRAEARTLAETTVRKENPLAWLRYGPGREKAGQPGWTESHEVSGPSGGPIPHEGTVKIDAKDVAAALGILGDAGALRLGKPAK